MNKLETAYALSLSARSIPWRYEAVKLRISASCWYTPDFEVLGEDGLEYHEVKGHWEDDARVKIRAAAELYPERRFLAVQRKKGRWKTEEIDPHGGVNPRGAEG